MTPLWKQVAVRVVAATVLAVAAIVVSKLVPDPYAGNIYWEPCLQRPFRHTGRCFFTAYRVVNKSSQPTKKPVEFHFEVYKPKDAYLIPISLPQEFPGERPDVSSTEARIIVMSSSDLKTKFTVYDGSEAPWDGKQTLEGWCRVVATSPDSVPADDTVDIVRLYWSFSPYDNIKSRSEFLKIDGVRFPDADSNRTAIAARKDASTLYWALFLFFVAATIAMLSWATKAYIQFRKDQRKRKQLHAQQAVESQLDHQFDETEPVDETEPD